MQDALLIELFNDLASALGNPHVQAQLGAIAGGVIFAWILSYWLRTWLRVKICAAFKIADPAHSEVDSDSGSEVKPGDEEEQRRQYLVARGGGDSGTSVRAAVQSSCPNDSPALQRCLGANAAARDSGTSVRAAVQWSCPNDSPALRRCLAANASANHHAANKVSRWICNWNQNLAGVLFASILWLLLLIIEHSARHFKYPTHLLHIAAILALTFALIRLGFYALRCAFERSEFLSFIERILALAIWFGVALYVLGVLPEIQAAIDSIIFTFGKTRLSLWQILQGMVSVSATLIAALWIGALLEIRLMNSTSLDSSFRVVLARFIRAILIVVAVLFSLSFVGIDLTVLSIFGGALGVGLGLGLQRIASNYVSGFIILLDRSLRIGDLITIDKYHGAVTQIKTRYTVLKALDGIESIIPNELLVSQPVQNHSYTSKQIRIAITVQISYDSDLEQAMALMLEAPRAHPRVLQDPAPMAYLSEFGADGINLELGFWIDDPEQGRMNVRSDVNLAVWKAFQKAGIQIPYPQRDVRVWMQNSHQTTSLTT